MKFSKTKLINKIIPLFLKIDIVIIKIREKETEVTF